MSKVIKMMDKYLDIKATIVRFIPIAMHDHLEDGSVSTFAASEVKIKDPGSMKDNTFLIYHDAGISSSSIWTKAGQDIQFSIQKMLLENDFMIYSEGLDNVHPI